MPAQSSMEGLAKIMAVGSIAKGGVKKLTGLISGDERLSKKMKKRAAKEKADQQRKILANEREEHKNWLRDNGSMLQAIKDRAWGWRTHLTEEQQAHKDNKAFNKQVKKDKKLEGKQRRAGFVSGMSTEEWAEQAAYNEAEDRANLSARDIEDRKKDIEQRRAVQADQMTLDAEGKELDNEYVKMGRERLLALIENKEFDEERARLQKEFNAKQKTAIGFLDDEPDDSGSPTVTPGENVGPGAGADIGGSGSGDVVAAIEKQTEEIVVGLGTHSPPFLETLTKETLSPSVVPENIGTDSAPDISATPDVSMEALTDGEPMVIMSDQIEELIQIERDELDFDRRREAREIKAERRALEDRRDSKFKNAKGLMGGKGKKPDKKKKPGILSSLFKFGARYLLPMVGGWLGLKTVLGLSTKADDAARATKVAKNLATKGDDAARIAKNLANKTDDAGRVIKNVGGKVDDVLKTGAKGAKLVKIGDAAADAAGAAAKGAKLVKVGDAVTDVSTTASKIAGGVKATNLGKVTTSVDTAGKGVIKTLGGKLDKFGVAIKNLPKATVNIIKGSKGLGLIPGAGGGTPGVKPRNIRGEFVRADGFNSVDDAIKAKGGPTVNKAPTGNAGSTVNKAVKAVTNIGTEAAKPIANTVKTILKTTKVAGKLAMNVSKYLAPLDMINKMGQGQGFWESLGNMGLEIGNLLAGAGEYQVEMLQKGSKAMGLDLGEGGFSEKSAADIAFQEADILGNQEKWQTSYLEQGINMGVAAYTGTEQIANKKVYTEEQEALATAAENEAGAVDVGFGQGDIEDLEALSLLDPKSLEALLAFQVWDDEDQKQIEDLLKAKQAGIQVTYDDGGWLGGEKIKYGGLDPNATEEQRDLKPDVTDMVEYVPEPGQGQEGMFSGLGNVFGDIFSAFSPDPVAQHKMAETTTIMAENATTPGSIFTHDTHLENTLWTIWEEEKTLFGTKPVDTTVDTTVGIEGVSPKGLEMVDNMMPVPVIDVSPNRPVFADVGPKIPSELLAQVSAQISTMEKQAAIRSIGGSTVNSSMVQKVDNSVRSNNLPASTVFPPPAAIPAGIGVGA